MKISEIMNHPNMSLSPKDYLTETEKISNLLPDHKVVEVGGNFVNAYKDYVGRNEDQILVLFGIDTALVYRRLEGSDKLINVQTFERHEQYIREHEEVLGRPVMWVKDDGNFTFSSFLINYFEDDVIEQMLGDFTRYYNEGE